MAHEHGMLCACAPEMDRPPIYGVSLEFIPICGRNSRSSTWRTRSATSGGCGATLSL
jgi:hypothetical protein